MSETGSYVLGSDGAPNWSEPPVPFEKGVVSNWRRSTSCRRARARSARAGAARVKKVLGGAGRGSDTLVGIGWFFCCFLFVDGAFLNKKRAGGSPNHR